MSLTTLPTAVGIGLRSPYYSAFLAGQPSIDWVEVHSENFFGGGAPLHTLKRIREHYPLSLHGVGLGIASPDPLDGDHVQALASLIRSVEPSAVSEHLCWNRVDGQVINDLLPFPYSRPALALVTERVLMLQERLKRPILLENLSSYLQFDDSVMSESEFLHQLVQATDCGILLDINNLYVNQCNLGQDARAFMDALPRNAIGEYHLAGFTATDTGLIDSHSQPVSDEVWDLYQYALTTLGPRPTLIEWDLDLPPLEVLLGEADKARRLMTKVQESA
ncbi:DUF692 family multinuclear iron-containing protein [Pokkaliibacter sp. CJK22405]|uniref:MNIO family bufferin maturase n=1 Tax=Pokkaliibacter sp. CJK22405 TaxID=3384615 RepID=UPI0039855099